MTILVLSDSHGHTEAIRQAILRQPKAQAIIHLGDGVRDAESAQRMFPQLLFYTVRGNCDFQEDYPLFSLLPTTAGPLYLTHGWAEHVKSSYLSLYAAAAQHRAVAALFGHTHSPLIQYCNGMLLFNPGSVGGYDGSYGILEIEKNTVTPYILHLP